MNSNSRGAAAAAIRRNNPKVFDAESFRKRREAEYMEQRRERRGAFIAKRRNIDGVLYVNLTQEYQESELPSKQRHDQAVSLISSTVSELSGTDPAKVLAAVTKIKSVISTETAPPIGAVFAVPNCLSSLINLLNASSYPDIQFEVTWVITNIASGSSVNAWALVESGVIPKLVELLRGPYEWRLRGQAAWALGNISGDSIKCRDYLLSLGTLNAVIAAISEGCVGNGAPAFFMRNAAWALSSFFWGTPAPDVSTLKPALPAIVALVNHRDPEVTAEALWAAAHFTDGGDDHIQAAIESGLFLRVLAELNRQDPATQAPCLRTVGIVLTGSLGYVRAAVDMGVIPLLFESLKNARGTACKDACWDLSMIAATGQEDYISMLLSNASVLNLHQALIANTSGDEETRAKVGWIFVNIVVYSSVKQLSQSNLKLLTEALGKCITIRDSLLISEAVDGIRKMLCVGESMVGCGSTNVNVISEWIKELGALDALKALESHPRRDIAQSCSDLIAHYFSDVSGVENGDEEDITLS